MRLPPALTSGVSAALALLALTACSGGDAGESASATPSASSSASSSSASSSSAGGSGVPSTADVQRFCTQAQTVFADLVQAFDGVSDPAQLPALLDQAISAFGSVDPPAEIATSWASVSGSLSQLRDGVSTLDLSTPEGLSQFQQQYADLSGRALAARDEVSHYISANCPDVAVPSS